MQFRYHKWLNFLWYQTLWFTAIWGQNAFVPALAALLLLHLLLVAQCTEQCWRQEAAVMIGCGCAGIGIDSLYFQHGLFVFNEPTGHLVPLWEMCIWFGFAGTLRHGLSFVLRRPLLSALAGLVFAPLIYTMASRWGAVEYPMGTLPTGVMIGLNWCVLMPLFIAWINYLQQRPLPGLLWAKS